jgi:hypothetical protein
MREIACGDCVVSVLLNIKPAPGKNAELTNKDKAAINLLATAGLVPPLRFEAKTRNWANFAISAKYPINYK